jgi:hypothetical protein
MATLPPYHTKAEKEAIFTNCVFCDSTSDVEDWLAAAQRGEYDGKGMSFRGLTRASYKLFSSLQQEWFRRDIAKAIPNHREFVNALLAEAWQRHETRPFLNDEAQVGEGRDDLGMLSYLQHHGCPTPFLDFTTDIRVALYFATKESGSKGTGSKLDDYFSVYVFHPEVIEVINRGLEKAWVNHSKGQEEATAPWFRSYEMLSMQDTLILQPEWARPVFGAGIVQLATSERFRRQAGLFAMNNTAELPFPEAIHAFVDAGTEALKERASVRTWITSLNIHRDRIPQVHRWLAKQHPPTTKEHLLPEREVLPWVEEVFESVLKRAFEGRLA